MDGYTLSRKWFDYAHDNPEKIGPNHTALYFYILDCWNRFGNKTKFGLPTESTMQNVRILNKNTYYKTFDDLVSFGFIISLQESSNQYTARVISLVSKSGKSKSTLDKANIRRYQFDTTTDTSTDTTTDTTTDTSTVPIDKQGNKETKKQHEREFEIFWTSYPKKLKKPDALRAYNKVAKSHKEIMIGLDSWKIKWVGTEKQFIPYPATWLNARQWEDDLGEQKKKSAPYNPLG